jgi:signal transduction histidine kinase
VMQNLIGNAIKYRKQDRTPVVSVTAVRESDQWHFQVRDNGIGLETRAAARIFEPFIRLHADEFEGTGVGLAICRAVIERHGGRIWVEGEPDVGSTFHFTLPVKQSAATVTEPQAV